MKKTLRWLPLVLLGIALLACSITTSRNGNGVATPTRAFTVPSSTAVFIDPSSISAGKSPDVSQEVLVNLYERVSPGVVYIQVTSADGTGEASGFVYDTEGHIVTNYHVVNGADTIEVDFPSGFKAYAQIVGTDLDSDLAVIKVEGPANEFNPLPLGDSNEVKVGQTVVAIGNPFGYSGTMTVGIISAKGRTLPSEHLTSDGTYYTAGDIIQTDAAINPGNSGGPLLNIYGEVIGVNRAIASPISAVGSIATNSGIGFAVPVNIAKRVVPSLIQNGSFDYPFLGIKALSEIDLASQELLALPQATGAYVIEVSPRGPCDQAGIRGGSVATVYPDLPAGGDLIVAVDGQPVMVFGDLLNYVLESKSPGDTIVLTIMRDSQQKEVSVTLGKRS